MDIVDHPHAKELKRPGDQEEKVRGIAEVNQLEAMPAPSLPSQACFSPESGSVLAEKAKKTAGLFADPVPIDLNALQFLLGFGITAHLRANHDHIISRVAKGARLLPDAAIQRHRQILDNNESEGLAHARSPTEAFITC